MKKIYSLVLMLAMVMIPMVHADAAVPDWDTTGSWVVVFEYGGSYPHDMMLTQDGSGNLTGSGGYLAGNPPYSFAWTITSGVVDGDTISMTMDYTVGAVGTTMHMTGTIAGDGTMSGDWDDNYNGGSREGTWHTSSGVATMIDHDPDGDGVLDSMDKCPDGPTPGDGNLDDVDLFDNWGDANGRYRWIDSNNPDGYIGWESSGKGDKKFLAMLEAEGLEYTYGCTGRQILDAITAATGDAMEGHWKHGLTKGDLEAWHEGRWHIGPTYVETVEVPGTGGVVSSVNDLALDTDYFLEASGTYRFANWGDYGIADAEWASRDAAHYPGPGLTEVYPDLGETAGWVKGEGYYASECGLDVQVDGSCVDWGSFSEGHNYSRNYTGTGAPVSFTIYDSSYGDNTGSIMVDVIEDKWIPLW